MKNHVNVILHVYAMKISLLGQVSQGVQLKPDKSQELQEPCKFLYFAITFVVCCGRFAILAPPSVITRAVPSS